MISGMGFTAGRAWNSRQCLLLPIWNLLIAFFRGKLKEYENTEFLKSCAAYAIVGKKQWNR